MMTGANDDATRAATALWRGLWGRLTPDERTTGRRCYVRKADTMPAARDAVSEILARAFRSRVKSVDKWPSDLRADRLARASPLDPPLIAAIFARFLVDVHGTMVRRFLDLVGIAHVDGEMEPSAAAGDSIGVEMLRAAVRTISVEHQARDVALFLDALEGQHVPRLARLADARRQEGAPLATERVA